MIIALCVLPIAAFAQKDMGMFFGAGGGMNFGFDGQKYDDRPTSHNGAGYAGDFYMGGWLTPTIGLRAGYQGFGISDRYTDFGNRKYNYIHGDLLLRAHRNIIPYLHAGHVKIINPSLGAGAGIMFPIHLGKRVSIIPDIKTTAYSSRAYQTGNNNMAFTVSATLGLAVRFGGSKAKPKQPEYQENYVPAPVPAPDTTVKVIRDTVVVHDVIEVKEVVRDTVYVPEIREPETNSALALFDTDKSDLRPEVLPELDKIAAWFFVHPNAKGEIEGHTDNTAYPEYNQRLSERRALAVFMYLVGKGIDPERLSFTGYGQERPVAPNTTAEGRQKNRRVEIKVTE